MAWACKLETGSADMQEVIHLAKDAQGRLGDSVFKERRGMKLIVEPSQRAFVVKGKDGQTIVECHEDVHIRRSGGGERE